jgi:hypothetical protein
MRDGIARPGRIPPRRPRSEAQARFAGMALCLIATALATACTYSQSRVVRPGKLSPTLGPFIYKEEGSLILMTVGVNATRFHGDDPFIPLEVGVANKGVEKYISLDRESFTLTDTFGRRYGMAGVEEVRRLQSGSVMDRQVNSVEFSLGKFEPYHRVDSQFFPLLGATLLQDHVEVPKFSFMYDILYFPRPDGDLVGGVFELHLRAKQLPEEVFVVFEVPR